MSRPTSSPTATASHTPGPWYAGGSTIYQVASSCRVAATYGMKDTDAVESYAQRVANERLIAAAPELLAACQLAVRALNLPSDYPCTCTEEGSCENCLMLIDAQEAARVAIAKVEGREP